MSSRTFHFWRGYIAASAVVSVIWALNDEPAWVMIFAVLCVAVGLGGLAALVEDKVLRT